MEDHKTNKYVFFGMFWALAGFCYLAGNHLVAIAAAATPLDAMEFTRGTGLHLVAFLMLIFPFVQRDEWEEKAEVLPFDVPVSRGRSLGPGGDVDPPARVLDFPTFIRGSVVDPLPLLEIPTFLRNGGRGRSGGRRGA